MTETAGGADGRTCPATDSAADWAFWAFFANSIALCLAGEGGGLCQRTTQHWAPKAYTLRAQIRAGARLPSGSSKAMTREDCKPG